MGNYHLQEQKIPDGFQIFEERLEVAGLSFRKADAVAFIKSGKKWLDLEREPNNKYDKNAIRIIGCSKGFFGTKRRFIGYVPKEVAELIVTNGFWGHVQPRLLKTYLGSGDFVEILFQILGPKGKKNEYNPPASTPDGKFIDIGDRLKQLKAEKKFQEAISFLLELLDEAEKEAKAKDYAVHHWYYEDLAILYRKEKQIDKEVEILERYENQAKASGSQKLADRLIKARELKEKKQAKI